MSPIHLHFKLQYLCRITLLAPILAPPPICTLCHVTLQSLPLNGWNLVPIPCSVTLFSATWFTVATRMRQKWHWDSLSPGFKRSFVFLLLLSLTFLWEEHASASFPRRSNKEDRHVEQILDQPTPRWPTDMRNKCSLTHVTMTVSVSYVHN